jgi:hemolysin activation/secretion protein
MIMNSATRMTWMICLVLVLLATWPLLYAGAVESNVSGELEQQLETKRTAAEKIEAKREAAAKAKREAAEKARQETFEKTRAKLEQEIAKLSLPEDTTPRLTVKEIRITGNTLISTDELLKNVPPIYNASKKPLAKAPSKDLYDFRVLQDVILQPGESRQISSRTIQGFTQYLLSVYQARNYAGIYVYVPTEAAKAGAELKDGILPITVLEASVTEVTVKSYDPNQQLVEKGFLRKSAVEDWSPVKAGQPVNQKELDDFVNLLNLNPDRYVSAVVAKGATPGSVAVSYDIYEANPWHWFAQIDNSGTEDRQWTPRIGLINTNLFGIDDTFTAIYQTKPDSTYDETYALYGSYDFPILGPKLRLNLYGGYSEFDINPATGGISFLGRGDFYGGVLRYNAFQGEGWFFDILGGLSHERSKVTPSLFPAELGTDIKMNLGTLGVDIHRTNDMSNSSLTFEWIKSIGGGSDKEDFGLARIGAEPDFTIYTGAASHSQFLDPNKVNRLSGTFRWIGANERLVPAKMTAFGGMYSVRGYDELEFVADGGILASAQYEFDVVKYEQSKEIGETAKEKKPWLRKLAPLVFLDYGWAKIIHPTATEKEHEDFLSVGPGALIELGEHFSGAVYYGYPLKATEATDRGDGRLNVSLMVRW